MTAEEVGPGSTADGEAGPGTGTPAAARPARVAVRAAARAPSPPPRSVPGPDDLYQRNQYGETLLRSLMRAQIGVTVGVLLPAAAVVATYPLLSVLLPQLSRVMVGPIPLSILVLGFGIYPPFVALGVLYVRRSRRVEERFVHLLREE